MHVLFLSDGYPNSEHPQRGTFLRDQFRALHDLGVKVGVASADVRSTREVFDPSTLRKIGRIRHTREDGFPVVESTAFNITPCSTRWGGHRLPPLFDRLLRAYIGSYGRPNLLHAHVGLWPGICAEILSRRYALPFIITEHASRVLREIMPPHERSRLAQAYARASEVIAVSTQLAAKMTKLSAREFPIVHNTYQSDIFGYHPEQRRAGLIVSVGSLRPVKRRDLLIRSFARAVAARPGVDWQLRIIGSGPDRRQLIDLSQRLGVARRVEFLGGLAPTDVARHVRCADVFALTSDHETFGVAVVEALACGVPVVVTDCGGTRDFVGSDDGTLCPPGNVDAIARSLIHTLENGTSYHRRDIAGRAAHRFQPTTIATQVYSVYQKVTLAL